jgi:exodeoxyribonuclease V beta subunit
MSVQFTPTSDLVPGATLIEASAGTGKTYQITNIVVRLIAEHGIAIDKLLVVTFTNAATAELCARIRKRIVEAIEALEGTLGPKSNPLNDETLQHLCASDQKKRLDNLRIAREDFDTASISTIHGFCRTVLQLNAFESGAAFDLELVENVTSILEELVDDFISKTFYDLPASTHHHLVKAGGFSRVELLQLAGVVYSSSDAIITPSKNQVVRDDWRNEFTQIASSWESDGKQTLLTCLADAQSSGVDLGNYSLNKNSGEANKPLQTHLKNFETLLERHQSIELLDLIGIPFTVDKLGPTITKALGQCPIVDKLNAIAESALNELQNYRSTFIDYIKVNVQKRLTERRQQTFDDLLRCVADAVDEHTGNPDLVHSLRERYKVALLDEFQDTDPIQWKVFWRIFGQAPPEEEKRLYLIGDPKQAIYSFRGADVFIYLDAKNKVPKDRQFTMEVNHRSDGRLVAGMNAFFKDKKRAFDLQEISYINVSYANARKPWDAINYTKSEPMAPFRLQWVDGRALNPDTGDIRLAKGSAETMIYSVVGRDIVELLEKEALLLQEDGSTKTLQCGDIAVLVRTNAQASAIQDELRKRGIPSVCTATGSVLESEESYWMQLWLRSVSTPRDSRAAKALAMLPLFSWTPRDLLDAMDGENQKWTEWMEEISLWSGQLKKNGIAAAFGKILNEPDTLENILSLPDAERRLTNLRHLIELLHKSEIENHFGAAGLLAWLKDQSDNGSDSDDCELRLESDADAVKIVTLHKSKGLQYGVVFLPFLWDGKLLAKRDKNSFRFHRHLDGEHQLCLDVDLNDKSPSRLGHLEDAKQESIQENLRLLYVGITRACHHVVLYWGPFGNNRSKDLATAPLAHMLHGDNCDSSQSRSQTAKQKVLTFISQKQPSPDALFSDLEELAAGSHASDWISEKGHSETSIATADLSVVDGLLDRAVLRQVSVPADDDVPEVRQFPIRNLDLKWKRWSYSSLTRGKEANIEITENQQPEDLAVRDYSPDTEGVSEAPYVIPDDAKKAENIPLFSFPRGPEPGTMVHRVLELLDFQTFQEKPPRKRSLDEMVSNTGRGLGVGKPEHHQLLCTELKRILCTPLGEQTGDFCLKDLSLRDRLDELDFDLPLGRIREDNLKQRVDPIEFKEVFCQPRAGDSVPADYLSQLRNPDFIWPPLYGFLTGSIDLAFRINAGPDGTSPDQKWFIADYKTNRLGPKGKKISQWQHYDQPWMQAEMAHHHYFIQYHLYLIAMHRYLRLRLPNYSYERNIGGALYLFVRGMRGEDTPEGPLVPGVFFDKPPVEVIQGLDTLFSGRQ